jgi:hypothetical protein
LGLGKQRPEAIDRMRARIGQVKRAHLRGSDV